MRAFLVVVLVLGLALAAFGALGLLGVWGSEPAPQPAAESVVAAPAPGTGPVRLGNGTLTVIRVYEDGGTIGFAAFALLGVALAVLAGYGLRRARARA